MRCTKVCIQSDKGFKHCGNTEKACYVWQGPQNVSCEVLLGEDDSLCIFSVAYTWWPTPMEKGKLTNSAEKIFDEKVMENIKMICQMS